MVFSIVITASILVSFKAKPLIANETAEIEKLGEVEFGMGNSYSAVVLIKDKQTGKRYLVNSRGGILEIQSSKSSNF